MVARRYYQVEEKLVEDYSHTTYKHEVRREILSQKDADLVGSLVRFQHLENSTSKLGSLHLPLFDFDYDVELHPSGTEGHFHVYLNKTITWRQYKRVMRAMVRAGLLEKGYYRMAKKRRQAFLRTPDKPKPVKDNWTPDVIINEDGTCEYPRKVALSSIYY